jgi:hypothetical protein
MIFAQKTGINENRILIKQYNPSSIGGISKGTRVPSIPQKPRLPRIKKKDSYSALTTCT